MWQTPFPDGLVLPQSTGRGYISFDLGTFFLFPCTIVHKDVTLNVRFLARLGHPNFPLAPVNDSPHQDAIAV
ncbi:MAG: hypothetical protein HY647_10800 [Acidobacteria bacterium]|nr:hypothetical protein [Acidobacteriota bacterium]